MEFRNPEQAQKFYDETTSAYKSVGQTLATRIAVNRCMYEGAHWIAGGMDMSSPGSSVGRLWTNWRPDSAKLVATLNRVPKLIQECAAATFPDRMEAEAVPGDRDTGIEAANHAVTLSAALQSLLSDSNYVEAARMANFRRCIDGTHGIGWGIKAQTRTVKLRKGGEAKVQDSIIRAFSFPSTRLVLDPSIDSPELDDHDFVIYEDVWTVDKIARDLGVQLEPEGLQTCGQLLAGELAFNLLSQGRLYTTLPLFSKSKGAKVVQMHVKDESGRFSQMFIGVRTPQKDMQWVNFDDPETPFGGNGLPLQLLHGYRRADSMWSVSDVAMLKDDQDRLNLLATFFFRMLQKNAGFQWLVAEEGLQSMDRDEFKSQFNNYVAGLVTWKQGPRERQVAPPQLIKYPDPPQFIQEAIGMYQEDMRQQVHRPDITAGGYKTHTTNATFQTAMNAANQVLGNRTREDITTHERMFTVGLGTMVKLAQEQSPTVLANLARDGFDEQDFAVLAQTDPYYPSCDIRLRDSSIKYQSREQKEQRIWQAVQTQSLQDVRLRNALADLDISLDDNDHAFHTQATKAANRVLLGEQWQPVMLGEYSQFFLNAFRRAMFDRRAMLDPTARQRLEQAIQSQMQYDFMQQQMAAAAQQPPQPAQPQGQPEEAKEQPDTPSEADLGQLLQAIQQGSTQPVAAA